jgi:sugar lactone lactonase YvrE
MNRRESLAGFAAAGGIAASEPPARPAKVVKLFKSPDGHPNGLETSTEGLWIGEQITDRAHLVDWNGKLIRSVETDSSNTSGIAYGGGYLWMAANGKALWRPVRPTDATTGEIIQADPATGKTVARHRVPGGGGVHGLTFAEGKLWITSLRIAKLSQVDPADFRLVHQIPVQLTCAHGLAWDPPGIWCMFSNDRVIQKLDARDGRVLEVIRLSAADPDPHGMCMYQGKLYYCDAGIGPGGTSNRSPWAGYICRIDTA